MTLSTPLTRAAGIDVPIICGAMYPCSNPELVAAASEAGGIGVVEVDRTVLGPRLATSDDPADAMRGVPLVFTRPIVANPAEPGAQVNRAEQRLARQEPDGRGRVERPYPARHAGATARRARVADGARGAR